MSTLIMVNEKSLWSSFRTFFSTYIWPLIVMTPPVPRIPQLFISPVVPVFGWFEVHRWARAMQSCDDAAQCFVKRVVHCKCKEDHRHEFLRFEISSPEGFHTAIVFADRRVDVSQGVNQTETALSPSLSPPASEKNLLDVAWIATKGCRSETALNDYFRNYIELRSLTFPHHDSRPSAQYLSALLQTTSMHEKYHELDEHQCHWFAHTVFESLRILHPSSLLSSGGNHMKHSQYCENDFPKAESADAVCKKFPEVWKTFLERRGEDQWVQQAKWELVSGCFIVLICAEYAFAARL